MIHHTHTYDNIMSTIYKDFLIKWFVLYSKSGSQSKKQSNWRPEILLGKLAEYVTFYILLGALWTSIKLQLITEPIRKLKILSITLYKTISSYSHHCLWFILAWNWYCITVPTLLPAHPSIRIYLNYRMVAWVAYSSKPIFTLTGPSLGIMRLIQIQFVILEQLKS